jgi:adenosine deaminase
MNCPCSLWCGWFRARISAPSAFVRAVAPQFRVTVNTDNRLMSQVSLSSEFELPVREFGCGWPDIEWLTINALKSAFAPFGERLLLINMVFKPGFATARALIAESALHGRGQ